MNTKCNPCKGMNCGTTDYSTHSPECEAEHAAAIAGGVFVKRVSTAWLVESNGDLTEGRGPSTIAHITRSKSTALRLGKGKYVQGGDCPVKPCELFAYKGVVYGPITVVQPTKDDDVAQQRLDAHEAALTRAKALGLSDDEIKQLRG